MSRRKEIKTDFEVPPCFTIRGFFGLAIPGRPPVVAENTATLVGLEDQMEYIFNGGTGGHSWYLGLIDADGYTVTSIDDTAGSHSGWVEATDYTFSGTAQRAGAASISTNRSGHEGAVSFDAGQVTFTANLSVKGMFVITSQAHGGGGILLATATFFPAVDVLRGDKANLSYQWTISGTEATKVF